MIKGYLTSCKVVGELHLVHQTANIPTSNPNFQNKPRQPQKKF